MRILWNLWDHLIKLKIYFNFLSKYFVILKKYKICHSAIIHLTKLRLSHCGFVWFLVLLNSIIPVRSKNSHNSFVEQHSIQPQSHVSSVSGESFTIHKCTHNIKMIAVFYQNPFANLSRCLRFGFAQQQICLYPHFRNNELHVYLVDVRAIRS